MSGAPESDVPFPPAQAAAVIERAANLSAMGLPLPSGLRAAAGEEGSRGLGRALRGLAGQLERGRSLEEILAASRVPKHLAGVLRAAQQSGQFGAVLTEWIENRRAAAEHWRSLQMALAYPIITFLLTTGVYLIFLALVVRPFGVMYEEFGLKLPGWTALLIGLAGYGVEAIAIAIIGSVAMLIALRIFGGRAGWSRLMTQLPLVGPAWHFGGVAETLRNLAILVDNRLPLPESLHLAADGAGDEFVGVQCRKLAERVSRGTPLWAALIELRSLPLSIVPLVRWGEMHDSLGEALRTAAEMLEGRLRVRSNVLTVVLPPLIFILVGVMASSLIALYLPMASILQGLS